MEENPEPCAESADLFTKPYKRLSGTGRKGPFPRTKKPENAQNLPETGHFPAVLRGPRTAPRGHRRPFGRQRRAARYDRMADFVRGRIQVAVDAEPALATVTEGLRELMASNPVLRSIVERRSRRKWLQRPVPDEAVLAILEAGRWAPSAGNFQPWHFVVATSRHMLDQLAGAVYAPENIECCAAAVAVVVRSPNQAFDAGRATQDMILAAWSSGIGSCPNGVRERERAHQLLQVADDRHIAVILSFGYPREPQSLEGKTVEGLLSRIKRKPLEEIVTRL
jgi:nitroreductase